MLAAIEQIEDAAAAKWEKDLLLLREYYERLLPDEDRRRIDWRLVLDAEFQRMTVVHARPLRRQTGRQITSA